jgi:radical SAM superfamily enzyme YgiQ (UPF0313 family)
MKILLIYPKVSSDARGTVVKYSLVPPQSLTAVAALTPDEHDVRIVDENHQKIDYSADVDLVGITVFISSSRHAYDIASKFRLRGIPVVLGGLHVTTCPQDAEPHADAVVVGEAEGIWQDLLQDAEAGTLKKRYELEEAPQLAGLPIPRRDKIDVNRYLTPNSLLATRGCPYKCKFCYRSSLKLSDFRTRPVDEVVREIETFHGRYAVLLDDNLIADRAYARKLLKELAGRNIAWMGAGSIDMAEDPELMDLLTASGCRSMFIGLESLSEENLAAVGKRSNKIERYDAAVRTIHEHGIMINASFVYGFDHDDPGVFERTVEWGIKAKLDTATFHILTPYPGTPLAAELERDGRIVDRNFAHYDTAHVVFQPKLMTAEELMRGYLWSYRKFYSWNGIARRTLHSTGNPLPRLLMNVGYKKIEPAWELMIACGHTSWIFKLFVKAIHAYGTVGFRSHGLKANDLLKQGEH